MSQLKPLVQIQHKWCFRRFEKNAFKVSKQKATANFAVNLDKWLTSMSFSYSHSRQSLSYRFLEILLTLCKLYANLLLELYMHVVTLQYNILKLCANPAQVQLSACHN